MEGIPSENKKVLAGMGWDERLKEARARRGSALREKNSRTTSKNGIGAAEPVVVTLDTVEEIRFGKTKGVPQEPLVPKKPRGRRRWIALAFAAGIALGVCLMAVQNLFSSDARRSEQQAFATPPVAEERVATPDVSNDAQGPAVLASGPVANSQFVSMPQTVPPPIRQDQILAAPLRERSLTKVSLQPELPAITVSVPEGAARELPGVGSAPQAVDVVATSPNIAPSAEDQIGPDFAPAHFGLDVVEKEWALSGVLAMVQTDKLVDTLGSASASAADLPPQSTVAPIARPVTDARVWIFATTTVGADAVASARSAVETSNLSVQAVNRVSYRISANQVRYYDAASAEAAERLAAAIGATARDFTSANSSASAGTLEVYLSGDAVVARARSSVATATGPRTAPQSVATERLRNSIISRIRDGLGN